MGKCGHSTGATPTPISSLPQRRPPLQPKRARAHHFLIRPPPAPSKQASSPGQDWIGGREGPALPAGGRFHSARCQLARAGHVPVPEATAPATVLAWRPPPHGRWQSHPDTTAAGLLDRLSLSLSSAQCSGHEPLLLPRPGDAVPSRLPASHLLCSALLPVPCRRLALRWPVAGACLCFVSIPILSRHREREREGQLIGRAEGVF